MSHVLARAEHDHELLIIQLRDVSPAGQTLEQLGEALASLAIVTELRAAQESLERARERRTDVRVRWALWVEHHIHRSTKSLGRHATAQLSLRVSEDAPQAFEHLGQAG
eukprot:4317232-Prymnesium_polylepis.1